jgi:sarcosine oxidase
VRVVVVGAGVVGAMTAWRLAVRGAEVVVCDRFGVATERSSSHGGTRIFRRAVFEGPHYLPFIELSSELWVELGDLDPSARMLVTGGLTIGPSDGALVADAVAAAEAASVAFEALDSDELTSRFPQHVLLPGDVGVFEPGAGVLRAESVVRVAIAEARRLGAVMHSGARITEVTSGGDGVVVHSSGGTLEADAVVVAAGAGLPALVPDLELPLVVERSMHVWFGASGSSGWSTRQFPVFVRESGPLQGWGIGDVGDGRVKIGTASPKPTIDKIEAHLEQPPGLTPAEVEPVAAYVRSALVDLDPEPIAAQPCLNVFAPDGDFIVGAHPHDPRIVIAGAGSGHSFKHAPAIGEVVADLVLDGATATAIDRFDPMRFLATP